VADFTPKTPAETILSPKYHNFPKSDRIRSDFSTPAESQIGPKLDVSQNPPVFVSLVSKIGQIGCQIRVLEGFGVENTPNRLVFGTFSVQPNSANSGPDQFEN
jgi:hypothetical protein